MQCFGLVSSPPSSPHHLAPGQAVLPQQTTAGHLKENAEKVLLRSKNGALLKTLFIFSRVFNFCLGFLKFHIKIV